MRAEQGFGDTIQFCRFVPVDRRARDLEVQPSLRRLVTGLQGVERIFGAGETLVDFDLCVPFLGLPHLLRFTPVTVPYLRAEPALIAAWRERLGHGGFRDWHCVAGQSGQPGRAWPLLPLGRCGACSLPGVRLISLQKHHGLEQLPAAAARLGIETPELDAGADAFVDTAAVMECVDLIVTSDTSIAHLAGALGRPVWVALQHVPDWRWQLDRDDCPWYPSMRLFRQTRRGDWEDVFARITAAAADLVPA